MKLSAKVAMITGAYKTQGGCRMRIDPVKKQGAVYEPERR
jgi:hypothetical protein